MSFTKKVDNRVGYNVEVNNCEYRLEWVLDSDCIDHIIKKCITNSSEKKVELKDLFFVKEMHRNLMSFGKVADKTKIVSMGNTSRIYTRENQLIAVASKVNNLYKISSFVDCKQTYETENVNKNMTLKENYHRLLGHVNFKYLNISSHNTGSRSMKPEFFCKNYTSVA